MVNANGIAKIQAVINGQTVTIAEVVVPDSNQGLSSTGGATAVAIAPCYTKPIKIDAGSVVTLVYSAATNTLNQQCAATVQVTSQRF